MIRCRHQMGTGGSPAGGRGPGDGCDTAVLESSDVGPAGRPGQQGYEYAVRYAGHDGGVNSEVSGRLAQS